MDEENSSIGGLIDRGKIKARQKKTSDTNVVYHTAAAIIKKYYIRDTDSKK